MSINRLVGSTNGRVERSLEAPSLRWLLNNLTAARECSELVESVQGARRAVGTGLAGTKPANT